MKSKTLRRWTIWLAVITIAEVAVFHHYNQQLTPNSQVSPVRKYTHKDFHEIANVSSRELRPNLYSLSPDNSEFAYVDTDNTFLIIDTKSGKVLVNQPLSYKPDFIKWIGNSQLFVGTENQTSSGLKNIRFSTFDVNSKAFRLIHVFKQYKKTASLENVAFSPYTNDVYVLLGDANHSIEYHFDTNNTMFPYHLSGRLVRNLMVSQTSDQLYYQDYANGEPNIFVYDFHTSSSHLIARNAKLLSLKKNTLTYAKLNQSGEATSLKTISNWKKGSTTRLQLSSAMPFSQLLVNGNQIYRKGSTKMTDLQTKKSITLPDNKSTVNWEGNLYVLQSSGKVYYFDPSAETSTGASSQSNGSTTGAAGSGSSGSGLSNSGGGSGLSSQSNGSTTGAAGSGSSGSGSSNSGGGSGLSGQSNGSTTGTAGSGSSGSGSSNSSPSSSSSGTHSGSGGSITGNSIITPSK